MRPGKHSIEDLMVQARRLELSTEEQCRLRVALDASQENRLLQAAGRGFDEESSVRPGDDELIARIAQRLESQAPTRAWRRWREPVLIAVGAMVLTTAAAGAWIAAGQSSRPVQDSAPVNGRGSATTDQQTGRIGSQRPRRPIESSVRAQSSALPPERGCLRRGASRPRHQLGAPRTRVSCLRRRTKQGVKGRRPKRDSCTSSCRRAIRNRRRRSMPT